MRHSSFFMRLRNVVAAPELAGLHKNSAAFPGRAAFHRLVSRPMPAQFFFCPRQPRSFRHAVNCRGLRLVWLLTINGGLR